MGPKNASREGQERNKVTKNPTMIKEIVTNNVHRRPWNMIWTMHLILGQIPVVVECTVTQILRQRLAKKKLDRGSTDN
jgi:hypothetical protein